MDFSRCFYWELSLLEGKLICCFKLATGIVVSGVQEFVDYADGLVLLKEDDGIWFG